MSVAWGVLLPSGAFFSLAWRSRLTGGRWLRVHRVVQVCFSLLAPPTGPPSHQKREETPTTPSRLRQAGVILLRLGLEVVWVWGVGLAAAMLRAAQVKRKSAECGGMKRR